VDGIKLLDGQTTVVTNILGGRAWAITYSFWYLGSFNATATNTAILKMEKINCSGCNLFLRYVAPSSLQLDTVSNQYLLTNMLSDHSNTVWILISLSIGYYGEDGTLPKNYLNANILVRNSVSSKYQVVENITLVQTVK
jgi:hypothetical protein